MIGYQGRHLLFQIKAGEQITERDVVRVLNEFIFEQKGSLGNSSRTLVAYGPNAAYHNYEPTPTTDTMIFPNSTIILDSGGQYFGKFKFSSRFQEFHDQVNNNFRWHNKSN